jgi:hypothetical protein
MNTDFILNKQVCICVSNECNVASLIVGKVYQRISDTKADSLNMVRIVDEDKSEMDGYLYPAVMFACVEHTDWTNLGDWTNLTGLG